MSIPIYVGFDQVEAVAYHTFCQSVIERASQPVEFHPLSLNLLKDYRETHKDGSNEFIYSRFLVPHLQGYKGWALFCDGDMVCTKDIAKLWALRDEKYAVMVVKHDYQTKYPIKYLGQRNESYPRKNWSSVILFNCGHPANFYLTPGYVERTKGSVLHRMGWLPDELIGELPVEWNWLAGEYGKPEVRPGIIHYTIGTPCFNEFRDFDLAEYWHQAHENANHAEQLPRN